MRCLVLFNISLFMKELLSLDDSCYYPGDMTKDVSGDA